MSRAYHDLAARLEPGEAIVSQERALVSIAISLKRIADAVENNTLGDSIYNGITQAAHGMRRS